MATELSKAQINHLRRLLGWVRCEIPPDPEEIKRIVQSFGRSELVISQDGKDRLVEWHREATNIPKYIRAALKALEPAVREAEGEFVDGNPVANRKVSGELPDNRKYLQAPPSGHSGLDQEQDK